MSNRKIDRVDALARDPHGAEARRQVCEALAEGFARVGERLWVTGWMVGPDRPAGRSPFQFGSDAMVGLATLAQTAGELISGINRLSEGDNRYAIAALLRQLVEVEYLTWAFAEAEDDAAIWLRSTREERLKLWSPARLRDRAHDRFTASDYWRHCELGGHPTPDGRMLLPNHASGFPSWALSLDTARHGAGAWRNIVRAVEQSAYATVLQNDLSATSQAIDRWRQEDSLSTLDAWDDSNV